MSYFLAFALVVLGLALCQPLLCVLVDKTAHRAYGYGSTGADAVKTPAEAVLIRPAGCRDGVHSVLLEPCCQQLVAVVIPALERGREVGVKREVRP